MIFKWIDTFVCIILVKSVTAKYSTPLWLQGVEISCVQWANPFKVNTPPVECLWSIFHSGCVEFNWSIYFPKLPESYRPMMMTGLSTDKKI